MVIGDAVEEPWVEQAEAASQRYEQSKDAQEANEKRRKRERRRVLDTEAQLTARIRHLAETGRVTSENIVEVAQADPSDMGAALERILDANDLQSARFLYRGVRACATVGRISRIRGGRQQPTGTGFLVSPSLLLTNNHVLPSAEHAAVAVVEFGAELDVDDAQGQIVRHHLDPDGMFVTDAGLDFTLVCVSDLEMTGDGRASALAGTQ
jgi:S1-C subfamily serine protease